jgi:hypothetical protein
MLALSKQRRIDNFSFPLRPIPNDGEIFLVQSLFLHQQTETPCGLRRFRDQHESARFAVQPIHNRNLSAASDLECEQLAHLFPERRALVRLGRMGQQTGRFIDHNVVVGFVDDREARRCSLRRINGVDSKYAGFGAASHSRSDLWSAWGGCRLRFPVSNSVKANRNRRDGNRDFPRSRNYVGNLVQQEHVGREPDRADFTDSAVSLPLFVAGGIRLVFGRATLPNLVSVIAFCRAKDVDLAGH